LLRALGQRKGQWQHAKNHGQRGHQDRAQPYFGCHQQGSAALHAVLAGANRKVDQQNGVLGHQAHQHHDADDGEHRQRRAEHQQRQHHANQGQWQRCHQCQGLEETLELTGQNHVDEDDGQHQRGDRVVKGFGHVFGRAAHLVAVAGRKADAAQRGLDAIGYLADRALIDIAADGDLARHVASIDLIGPGRFDHRGNLVQVNDARAAVGVGAQREGQVLQIIRAVAGLRRQPHVHVVSLVIRRAPVAHRLAGNEGAQGAGYLADAQAQIGGGIAPHRHGQRRLVGFHAGVQIDQARNRTDFVQYQFRQALEFGQILALQ